MGCGMSKSAPSGGATAGRSQHRGSSQPSASQRTSERSGRRKHSRASAAAGPSATAGPSGTSKQSGRRKHSQPSATAGPSGTSGQGREQRVYNRSEKEMTPRIMEEVVHKVMEAARLRKLPIVFLGTVGVSQWEGPREVGSTKDVDIMIPRDRSDVAEEIFLDHKDIYRTEGKGLGVLASDGECYGLDFATDRDLTLHFTGSPPPKTDLQTLLESKARGWLHRIGEDADKRERDVKHIELIIRLMKGMKERAQQNECQWVNSSDFWDKCVKEYGKMEKDLTDLGLQRRERTPSVSSKGSRRKTPSASGSDSDKNKTQRSK